MWIGTPREGPEVDGLRPRKLSSVSVWVMLVKCWITHKLPSVRAYRMANADLRLSVCSEPIEVYADDAQSNTQPIDKSNSSAHRTIRLPMILDHVPTTASYAVRIRVFERWSCVAERLSEIRCVTHDHGTKYQAAIAPRSPVFK